MDKYLVPPSKMFRNVINPFSCDSSSFDAWMTNWARSQATVSEHETMESAQAEARALATLGVRLLTLQTVLVYNRSTNDYEFA